MIYASQLFNSKIIGHAVAASVGQRSLRFLSFSTCTVDRKLRDCDQCPQPITRSLHFHFHNSHAFRLFRASRGSSGWPPASRPCPRSCASAASGAPSGLALRNIAIRQRMISGRSALRTQPRRSERATIVAWSPDANLISFARAVSSASRKNRAGASLILARVDEMRLLARV